MILTYDMYLHCFIPFIHVVAHIITQAQRPTCMIGSLIQLGIRDHYIATKNVWRVLTEWYKVSDREDGWNSDFFVVVLRRNTFGHEHWLTQSWDTSQLR